MDRYKEAFGILTSLGDEIRLKILTRLKETPDKHVPFKEFYNNIFNKKIPQFELFTHLRILCLSRLIENKEYLTRAEFLITPFGIRIVDALEQGQKIEKVVCAE